MYLYTCLLTDAELTTDVFPFKDEFDGILRVVEGKYVDKDEGGNFGIEGDDVDEATQSVKVINVVDACDLQETQFDKKSYTAALKVYMQNLRKKLVSVQAGKEEIQKFMTGAQKAVTELIMPKFDQMQFWIGKEMDPECMIVFSLSSEDGMTQNFYFWKHGLKETKV